MFPSFSPYDVEWDLVNVWNDGSQCELASIELHSQALMGIAVMWMQPKNHSRENDATCVSLRGKVRCITRKGYSVMYLIYQCHTKANHNYAVENEDRIAHISEPLLSNCGQTKIATKMETNLLLLLALPWILNVPFLISLQIHWHNYHSSSSQMFVATYHDCIGCHKRLRRESSLLSKERVESKYFHASWSPF